MASPSAKRQKIAAEAPSQLTDAPSDRAAKCKSFDVERIPLRKLAVWPGNRVLVPRHVHEIAEDMFNLTCKPTDGRCNKAPSQQMVDATRLPATGYYKNDAPWCQALTLTQLMTGNTVTKITLPDADGNTPTDIVVPLWPQSVPGRGGGVCKSAHKGLI
jgi:hypothetical protein